MNRVIFFLILATLVGGCTQSDQEEAVVEEEISNNFITEQETLDLLHRWTAAYLAGDAEPLNQILDDSWKYSGSSDGSVTGKAATIEGFANADYSFADIIYEDLDVQLYNDIAVLRGWETMHIVGSDASDTAEIMLRFTDVYQKKNGVVRAISTHSSPMVK